MSYLMCLKKKVTLCIAFICLVTEHSYHNYTHLSSTQVWHRGTSSQHLVGPLPRWDTTPGRHSPSSSGGWKEDQHKPCHILKLILITFLQLVQLSSSVSVSPRRNEGNTPPFQVVQSSFTKTDTEVKYHSVKKSIKKIIQVQRRGG